MYFKSTETSSGETFEASGDHFNRTLFVIDGLESYGDDWSMLEQYLHHFARTATWVLFRLRDPRQLRIFQQTAPNLFGRLERCLPIYQEGQRVCPAKHFS